MIIEESIKSMKTKTCQPMRFQEFGEAIDPFFLVNEITELICKYIMI